MSRPEMLEPSVSRQLLSRFRDRILAGTYPPGSPLRQDILASEFGTSKIPVREALVQLQSEGLVHIFPNRGFQVRPLSSSELDEVFSLRLEIEPAAASRGAKLAGAEDRDAAVQALAALDAVAQSEEGLLIAGRLNRAFHLELAVPRLQPVTMEVLGRLLTLSQRYVHAHLKPEGRVKRARREHATLLKAWSAGRARETRELLQAHIRSTHEDLKRAIGQG